jgi:hypothetical protein
MNVSELINHTIGSVKPTDTAGQVLDWMAELHLEQLPIVSEELDFIGLITENTLLEADDKAAVSTFPSQHTNAWIQEDRHIYEGLRLLAEQQCQVIAVTNSNGKYKGAARLRDFAEHISKTYAMQQQGGILEITVSPRSYSLAEIARLVESNDTKILSAWTDTHPQSSDLMFVTLKTNQLDLTRVIATLERFGYQVVAKYHESHISDTDIDRLNFLLRFIDI